MQLGSILGNMWIQTQNNTNGNTKPAAVNEATQFSISPKFDSFTILPFPIF